MSISYPASWAECSLPLVGEHTLTVAGYETIVKLDAQQLDRVYLPVLAVLSRQAESGRVLAGLAGVGGGGKSTFVAVLKLVADLILPAHAFVTIGMDGWHWPNRILDARTTTSADGCIVPLRERKGGPASFDIESLLISLRRLRETAEPVAVPVYDRHTHEPIPDALTVPPETRIILVEGNYVLGGVNDEPMWGEVAGLLHPQFFLACEATSSRKRMIDRHVRGGASRADAERKYMLNDQLNAEIINLSAARADFVIHPGPHPHIIARC